MHAGAAMRPALPLPPLLPPPRPPPLPGAARPAQPPVHADRGLRVCSDPNNLPFSNARGEGFENKLAELVAHDLHKTLTNVWTPQREHFVKDSLNAGTCDAIMGVPVGFDAVDVTRPYYASGYAFVYRADRHLDLRSIKDPRLKRLKIGVHLIGDGDTPPNQVLSREGIVTNVVGF